MENLLEIRNLCKRYNGFVLENVSFTLPKGYIMGFIGPNGAGKTTTIKLIMNLIKRDSGQIKVFGMDNIKNEIAIKERIGFVYDENYYYQDLTVIEMKKIIAPFYKKWNEQTFTKFLKEFNLPPRKKIKELSKGMKMKFSLALALSHEPELIIMDEPTSGLDPVFRNEMLELLADIIQDENKGVLFSTHITGDLEKVADYITFINNGKIVFSEQKDEVLNNYALIKGGRELLDEDIKNEFVGIRKNKFGFEALTDNINKIKNLFSVEENVIIEKATLEDIMFYIVKGDKNA